MKKHIALLVSIFSLSSICFAEDIPDSITSSVAEYQKAIYTKDKLAFVNLMHPESPDKYPIIIQEMFNTLEYDIHNLTIVRYIPDDVFSYVRIVQDFTVTSSKLNAPVKCDVNYLLTYRKFNDAWRIWDLMLLDISTNNSSNQHMDFTVKTLVE